MELIRDIIEWFGSGWGDRLAILFPLLLAGLIALYLLWLLLGYLRVSQVGLGEGHGGADRVVQPAGAVEGGVQAPRGVPYCPVDGPGFAEGATFCPICERDLLRDCINCGATLRATEPSCYRCGVRTGAAASPQLT